jgi:ribose 5-phosphate isomerase A
MVNVDAYKRQAAAAALDLVRPGMQVGLGTGSTSARFVELLGERVRAGLDIVGVATSEATRRQADRLGIPLASLDDVPILDLTVDGADEIAPDLSLIKGGGGALLYEKIVAAASSRVVIIADESKWVTLLGRFPLPIEVVAFGLAATRRAIETAAAAAGSPGPIKLRRTGEGDAFVTDAGHLIVDVALTRIIEPRMLADHLAAIPGVVEHGLFIGLAHTAIIAGADGVRFVERP